MKTKRSRDIATGIIVVLIAAACVLPFLLIVMSSITDEQTLIVNGYSFFPEKFSFYAYRYILTGGGAQILHGYLVSIGVTLIGTLISLILTVLLAYPLSRQDLPFRNVFAFMLFFTMLFNGGLVPSYMMWTQIFHIKNTFAALMVPNLLMNAFYVIMMRTYFTSGIPLSIIEAAQIDGASELKILYSIIIPLSKPMLATVGFMTALGYWNDWINGLYYVSEKRFFSIQNILNRMLLDSQFLASSKVSVATDIAAKIPSTGIKMSVAVVGILPLLIAYPFFQKYLVKGITLGGVKG